MSKTISWQQTWFNLTEDRRRVMQLLEAKFLYRPLTWFLEPAFLCVFFYRLSHYCQVKNHKKTGRLLMQINSLICGADIHPESELGAGVLIPSPNGLTFSGTAGCHVSLMPLSGTGGSFSEKDVGAGKGLPVLGNHVALNQFVGVQGAIVVGDRSQFLAGSCATSDVAPDSTVKLALDPQAGVISALRKHPQAFRCSRHRNWTDCKLDIQFDIDRYLDELSRYIHAQPSRLKRLSALLTNPLIAIFIYRFAHWLFAHDWRRTAYLVTKLNVLLFKITIHPASCTGPGLFIPHPTGVLFNGRAGSRLSFFDNGVCTSCDGFVDSGLTTSPILGDEVSIGGHAGVIGAVSVGDRVRIAPKVQVTEDIPSDTLVFSPMTRPISKPSKK